MTEVLLNPACPPPATPAPSPARRHRSGHCRDRHCSTDAGYSTLEFVLIAPVLLIFTLIVVQVALVWLDRSLAQDAARQGVQTARAYAATDADGRQAASTYLGTVGSSLLPAARIDVTRTPTTVTVRIHARVLPVPGILHPLSIDADSSGPIERFVSPDAR